VGRSRIILSRAAACPVLPLLVSPQGHLTTQEERYDSVIRILMNFTPPAPFLALCDAEAWSQYSNGHAESSGPNERIPPNETGGIVEFVLANKPMGGISNWLSAGCALPNPQERSGGRGPDQRDGAQRRRLQR
jgi:hypothetical protein